MCAVLDASVCSMVFGGEDRPDAGRRFFEWVNSGKGRLVIGGKLRDELYQSQKFKNWAATAVQYGFLKECDDAEVKQCEDTITNLESNDSHIIALALVSHARLLCTGDRDLMKDFRNKGLISKPKGSIYSIKLGSRFSKGKKDLLGRCSCKKKD